MQTDMYKILIIKLAKENTTYNINNVYVHKLHKICMYMNDNKNKLRHFNILDNSRYIVFNLYPSQII